MTKYFLLPLACICILASSSLCQETYMKVEGSLTVFKPESTNKVHNDATELLGVSFEVNSPRDPASGMASGKRQYQPVSIYKEAGASSPQFFEALTKNQILKKVIIEIYRPDALNRGGQTLGSVITIENVRVSFFRQQMGALNSNPNKDRIKPNVLYDEIRFSFEKITIEDKPGSTISMDSWSAN